MATEEEKRAKATAAHRRYVERNREKVNAQKRAWRDAHLEESRERERLWRQANPEKQREYRKGLPPEIRRAWAKEWREGNPEKAAAIKRDYWERRGPEVLKRRRERYAADEGLRLRRKEAAKRYRDQNRETVLEKLRIARVKNRDRILAQQREHKSNNRHLWALYSMRKAAKNQGVECDITAEWMKARFDAGICEMSGLPFDTKAKTRRGPNSPSIDRIVPGGPYTQANCRVILWSINHALSNYGEDYLLAVFARILARRQIPEVEIGDTPG